MKVKLHMKPEFGTILVGCRVGTIQIPRHIMLPKFFKMFVRIVGLLDIRIEKSSVSSANPNWMANNGSEYEISFYPSKNLLQ